MLTPSVARAPAPRNASRLAPLAGALLALLGADVATAAGVWKCAGAGGIPVYQDKPCDPGRDVKDLAADPPPLSVIPFQRAPPSSPPKAKPRRTEGSAPKPRRPAQPVAGDVAERRHVREGMTEGEVLARLGSPDLASPKSGRKARWTFLPAPGDPQTMTLIRFEDGRVVAVERVTVR